MLDEDDYKPRKVGIVDFAYQILEMNTTITRQQRELDRLYEIEEKYNKLLDDSISHNRHMIGSLLKLAMTPGVVESCAEHNKENWNA